MKSQDDEIIFMEQLGIEPIQLLTQIFNFTVMVVVLTKFLYKPILKKLDERRKKIEEGLAMAEKIKVEAENQEKKKQEILDEAKEEARKIIEDGKKTGKKVEAEIIEKAHTEANTILEKGKEELERERLEMEKELRLQTVEIAQTWVETVLKEVLRGKNQQITINKKIKDLERLAR